ncbi:hypothetical protein ABIA39_003422 [Nocardia sp. GAS34]|uniref:hypothetical protein n=1 Tax=unclassified Nocardia TaxID=2637762 RepID=UPI003D195A38
MTPSLVHEDPAGSYFDVWGRPTPPGDWAYDLDDFDIHYGPGWWPFYTRYKPFAKPEITRPIGVRLAPDTEYYSWRNEYVLLRPDLRNPVVVTGLLRLFVRRQGGGAICVDTRITVDMRAKGVHIPADCPHALRDQAQTKGERILRFLLHHRARRRAGDTRPVTAYDKWIAASDGAPGH